MNKIILSGRLTGDPEIRNSTNGMVIARYSLAVARAYKREGEPETDFFNVVAFGKTAEFVEKYLKKGMKILIEGHVQTGSYLNKDNLKVPTFTIIVDSHEFCESKGGSSSSNSNTASKSKQEPNKSADDFVNVAGDIDEELPFN